MKVDSAGSTGRAGSAWPLAGGQSSIVQCLGSRWLLHTSVMMLEPFGREDIFFKGLQDLN